MNLPPHLTQAYTSKSNVLLSNSANVHSRCPLLHPLLPGPCLKPRAHLLHTCLRERISTTSDAAMSRKMRSERVAEVVRSYRA
ncbi:hypothetical protein BHS07_27720 [Myxococcus xanthus]|nr:hypothetical protein BHS07_27720 [Myxococcus xanthus]